LGDIAGEQKEEEVTRRKDALRTGDFKGCCPCDFEEFGFNSQ
jgi:hypothetical protein